MRKKELVFFISIFLVSAIILGCITTSNEQHNTGNQSILSHEGKITPHNSPEKGHEKLNKSSAKANGENESNTRQIRVVDDFGYVVVFNKTPKRIVSLAPSNTEILFALGLGNNVVGVTDYCDYPPEAKKKPKIGGYSTVNIEKVLALNPDLVVAAYGNGAETIEILRGYGIRVVALNPKNLSDVMRDIMLLGKITGREENATRLVEMMKKKIDEVKRRAANISSKPEVAHVLWNDPVWVSGRDTFVDELIKIAGGKNAFEDMEGWKIVSIEDFLARNPDIIIVNSGTGMSKGNNILYHWALKELKDVKAVREGRVYVIDSDIISRPSYRLVYALEEISKIIQDYSKSKGK